MAPRSSGAWVVGYLSQESLVKEIQGSPVGGLKVPGLEGNWCWALEFCMFAWHGVWAVRCTEAV